MPQTEERNLELTPRSIGTRDRQYNLNCQPLQIVLQTIYYL